MHSNPLRHWAKNWENSKRAHRKCQLFSLKYLKCLKTVIPEQTIAHRMHETIYLVHVYRTNDKSKPNIYSSFPGDASCFPFWARKCGCAECIIASDKVGTNSLHTQNRYRNSQQSGCFSQNSNGYNQALQAKGRLGEDQVLNAQRRQGNANGIAVWPKKDRVTTLSDKIQTRDFRTSIQNPADPRTSAFCQSAAPSQSAITPVVDETNSFIQLSKTDSVVKGNEAVANYWPWYGASDEFSYHNQQHLRSIHQTSSIKLSSRDPRLRNKSECNGSSALTSKKNNNSIYQGHVNFLPPGGSGTIFRDEHPSEDNKSKRHREEIERSFLQGGTTTATWRNVSAMGQQPKPGQAQSVYPKKRAPATEKTDDLSGDNRNVQGRWGKQPMQLTVSELSNKHGVNEKISCGTNPHSNFSWNHTSLPNEKSCGTPGEKPQKWTPKKLDSFDWKNKHGTGDFDSFHNGGSQRKKQKPRTYKKALENFQDAKILEIYAREERIRNLKTLLTKQEEALDALRFQRKQFFPDELSGSFVDITNYETSHRKSSGQEDSVDNKEESCSSPGDNLAQGNSLKRRWLKNWNEEDQLDHKPPEKIEKTDETDSHGTLSDDGNQNLSNAEFTALEGLVRLSKD